MIALFRRSDEIEALRAEVGALKAQIEAERDSAARRLLDAQAEWLAIARLQQEALTEWRGSQDLLRAIEGRLDALDRSRDETKDMLARIERDLAQSSEQLEAGKRTQGQLGASVSKLEKRLQHQVDHADRAMTALAERIR